MRKTFDIKIIMTTRRNKNKDIESIDIIINECSPEQKYIILQNETLQKENKEITKLLHEIEAKITEYEEQIDNSDTSKRYIKGLLKNLVEIEKMRKEISDINKSILRENVVFITEYKNNMQTHECYDALLKILSIMIFFCLGFINNIQFCVGLLIYVVFFIHFLYKSSASFILPKNEKEMERIGEIETSIKETERNHDFLFDHIDSL